MYPIGQEGLGSFMPEDYLVVTRLSTGRLMMIFGTDKGYKMPPASNRTQRKRPGDLTGVRGQQLAAQAAREKEEDKAQVRKALEDEQAIKRSTEVDYSTKVKDLREVRVEKEIEVDGEIHTELVIEEIEVERPTRRIRVNWPIEDMTYGREVVSAGRYDERGVMIQAPILGSLKNYTFEEGRWYTVDAELAEHLEFLGYVYGE